MFGDYLEQSISIVVGDPGADNKQVHVWRAPMALEIVRGYITVQNSQNSGSAGAFTLQNFGTAGTAIKSTGGTVFTTAGGTATASQLGGGTPSALTVSEGTMASGEWLVLDYQETGDFVEGNVAFTIDYVLGIGA